MKLLIGLPLRNPDELKVFLSQLYDPTSPTYRKFQTPEQFGARFGPTVADYEAVCSYLRGNGFRITGTHPNRMLVEIVGSVAQVEKVFRLNMHLYQHPFEPREFFAPDAEPQVDSPVPILDIAGLENSVLPKPANLVQRAAPDRLVTSSPTMSGPVPDQDPSPLAGSGPGGSYMGGDFRGAYASGVALTGTGQHVALVQFDGYYRSDVLSYFSRAGLPNVTLTDILLDNFDGTPGEANIEVSLDIDMAVSMAPGLSSVLVYMGRVPNSIMSRIATDNIAKQISASWTYPVNATTTQIFQQFAAQGQSFYNASGDSGAYTGAPSPPTDNPYITSVGGTTLSTLGPTNRWTSETTWNWYSTGSGTSGSSGGFSTSFLIPTWQQGINMTTNLGSTTMRNIPDVAMVGDNVFVIANNGEDRFVGGTSVAAPLWAGFTALINQQALLTGQQPVGFINPAVYALGQSTGYLTAFRDIRTGNNTNPASPTRFYACPGYDLCTGWGTPNGKNLINALAPPPPYPVLVAGTATVLMETCFPTNGLADPGEPFLASFPIVNFGGVPTTNLIATLLATNGVTPLSNQQTYGAVAQGATVSRQFTCMAELGCGETLRPMFQLRDGTNVLGTVTFSLPTGGPGQAMAENFDGVTVPALPSGWTSAAANFASNWITSSTFRDTPPNAVFAYETPFAGACNLATPAIPITTTNARLTFRHYYNVEADPIDPAKAYDGGVLDMKIEPGTIYGDILVRGGSFASGGYTRTIQAPQNLLNNRQAWSGNSGGFVTTVVNLPASAAGKNVNFRWRLGMNETNVFPGGTGWYIDSIVVWDGIACCATSTNADLAVSQGVFPAVVQVGQDVAFSLTVTSLGPGPALGATLTNQLPANATFIFASPGYTNIDGQLIWNLGLLPLGRTTNFTVLLRPTVSGQLTNTVFVSSAIYDPNTTNNIFSASATVNSPPVITTYPSNQVVRAGADVTFHALATGTEPLHYQWQFGTTPLDGQNAPSLLLTNVQPADAGPYSVVVTNSLGSVTSPAAMLRVLVPPVIDPASLTLTSTNVSLALSSVEGLNYTLEYKDALTDAEWIVVGDTVPGTGAVITLQDTNTPALPTRFYRVNCE